MDKTDQLPLSFFPAPVPTLDSFVVGSNFEAFNIVKELSEGRGPQIVYLFGESGTGKTHLLTTLEKPGPTVPVFDSEKKIFVVDDVQDLSEEELAALLELANQVRAHSGTHLIVAGDKSPSALRSRGMRVDVTSRLGWGTVVELAPLSEEEKQQVFINRAHSKGLELSPEVMQWMSAYLPRDMRTLSRLLEELDAYSLSKNRRLTIPLIKEWLAKTHQSF